MLSAKSKSRPPASLRSIAEEVGVSVSLVSKVLSGRLGTSGANAQKIEAIRRKARELNYRKNVLATALRSGRQNVLGVCIHRHGAPGSGIVDEMVVGITDEANRHQQRLTLHYYDTADEFRVLLPGLHRNAIDGLILGGIFHPELAEELGELQQDGVPVVTICDSWPQASMPNVGTDQFEIGRRATLHLADQGCRQIAHFHVRDAEALPSERNRGCCAALAERGLGCEKLTLPTLGYGYEEAALAVRTLLASGVPFDGLVAQSDQQAAAVLNLVTAAGWRVPSQLKIIGVDNAPFCLYASVPLSSVSQEFAVRGRTAVDLLLKRLGGQPVSSILIAPVIHARESSAVQKVGE